MTETDMTETLIDALYAYEDPDGYTFADYNRISTYEDESMLTYDKGLVIKMRSGEVFQITILKVRPSN